MKMATMGPFVIGLATWFGLTLSTALGQSPPSPKSFPVFDATGYSNKPDLSMYGIKPIVLAYSAEFGPDWYKYQDVLPDLSMVQALAQQKAQQKGQLVVLDIEHWPLNGSPDLVRSSLAKYMTVIEWFRKAAPGLSLGYYGAPPLRDYSRAIQDPSSQGHQSWLKENDQVHSLAGAVDVFFPSLYTFDEDQAGWKRYAIAQIQEARRYGKGKPVYVFLWPQYHDANVSLGGYFLSAEYWHLQLETAKEHADGIVIWGGWDTKLHKPLLWDDNAPWWKVTQSFLKHGSNSPPAAPTSLTIR